MGIVKLIGDIAEKSAGFAVDVACECVEETTRLPDRIKRVAKKSKGRASETVEKIREKNDVHSRW